MASKRKDVSPGPGSPRSPRNQKKHKANGDAEHEDAKASAGSNGTTTETKYVFGSICHFDIPVVDMKRAMKFYTDVFEWECNPWRDNYALWKTKATPGLSGGFYLAPCPPPVNSCTNHSDLFVEDIDATMMKAFEHGATIIKSRYLIAPHVGCLGLLNDTEGNIVGLWSKNEENVRKVESFEQKAWICLLAPSVASPLRLKVMASMAQT